VQPKTRTRPAQFAETDNLRYRYTPPTGEPASNRLQRVDDLAPAPTAFGARLPERPDFNDGPTSNRTTPDYSYDGAGSLTSDANKRITRISYNHLRLPESVVWATGDSLRFRYTANGQKVAKLTYAVGKSVVRTDYLGPWQYEHDSLRWLSTSEGRALRQLRRDPASQPTVRYAYEYTLKDHVGNLRVAFRAPGLTPVKAADHLEAFLRKRLPLTPNSEWQVEVDERRWIHFVRRFAGTRLQA